jgi:glycosyl transferase family 87
LRYKPQLAVFFALMLGASMWFYVQRVLIPRQVADAVAHGRPRGNLSDLYPRWLGARELLLYHRDPYSPEVTREIQIGYYGRELDSSRPDDPKDQQGFAYPAYVAFLLAPTVRLPFEIVSTGFRWLLVILTGATVLLWLRVQQWRPPAWMTAAVIILTLGSFSAAQGIKLQQLSLLVSGLIAASMALLSAGHLFAAGVLLALATIKPQLVVPLAAWLVFWSLAQWKSRQSFFWGFALMMTLLVAGAQLILPGWIRRFLAALAAYRQYTGGGGSLLNVLLTPALGYGLAIVLSLGLALVCWRIGRAPVASEAFALTVAFVLAVTLVVIPMFAPYNQLVLLPGVLLIVRRWADLQSTSLGRFGSGIAIVFIGWPWAASAGLVLASTLLPPPTVQRAWAVPLYTSLYIPLAVLAVLALLTFDRLRSGELG